MDNVEVPAKTTRMRAMNVKTVKFTEIRLMLLTLCHSVTPTIARPRSKGRISAVHLLWLGSN